MSKVDTIRVNIKMSMEVKEWYQEEGKKYAMPMGNMMAYILTKHYENVTAAETMKDFNKLIQEAKEDGTTVESNKEMMAQFTELMNAMKGLE